MPSPIVTLRIIRPILHTDGTAPFALCQETPRTSSDNLSLGGLRFKVLTADTRTAFQKFAQTVVLDFGRSSPLKRESALRIPETEKRGDGKTLLEWLQFEYRQP